MNKIYLWILPVLSALFSCAASRTSVDKPQAVPLIRQYADVAENSDTVFEKSGAILTLPDALRLALLHNPSLSAFSLEMRAQEAAAVQASLFPNPTIMLEVENFAGSGPYNSFKGAETTISVGQLIQLSGKRAKQTKVAILNGDIAAVDYDSKRLEVYTQVVSAFNNVLAAQERVVLNRELLKLNEEFKNNIIRLIDAGRTSPVELSRANVEIANTQIELQHREKELAAARLQLAATWGATKVLFERLQGKLDYTVVLPEKEALEHLIEQNPDLKRWQTVQKQRRAVRDLTKAERIPDPSIAAGYRLLNGSDYGAFVAGLVIPLKIFNRNQGAIEEAEIRIKQSRRFEKAARINLRAELGREYERIKAAYQSIQSLKNVVIPQAQKAFDGVNSGYEQGKFKFIDVLDARRTLFSSRDAYLQILNAYQQLRVNIERLIGQSLENIE